jgi:hypothetical protein
MLEAGGQWQYEPPDPHDVGWDFVFQGTADVRGVDTQREFATAFASQQVVSVAQPLGGGLTSVLKLTLRYALLRGTQMLAALAQEAA